MRRFWYDPRIRGVLLQVAFVGGFVGLVVWLANNTVTNLARRGIAVGFDFMSRTARFPISESLLSYVPTDTFTRAILTGVVNTLFIAVIVVFAATALGLVIGLARRSAHPLASGLATIFVDLMRNTPLVVQLLFLYALVTLGLPNARQALNPLPGVFLSLRGLFVPGVSIDGSWLLGAASVLASIVLVVAGIRMGRNRREVTGRPNRMGWMAFASVLIGLPLFWWLAGFTVSAEVPRLQGFNYIGGLALTPEFFTIVVGLTLYSAAFIGEIIRGGIDAVERGQWEAAKAVGLPYRHTLRLVVIPQALRTIIPPMTSQYFNIVKNTTLALVVGYPDVSYVIATTINQTGQAIEGVAILMAIFLSISIAVSLLMNWYNRRITLVRR